MGVALEKSADRLVLHPRRGFTLGVSAFLVVLGAVLAVSALVLDTDAAELTRVVLVALAGLPAVAGVALWLSPRRLILDGPRRELIVEQRIAGLPQRSRWLYDELQRVTVSRTAPDHFRVVADGKSRVQLADVGTYAEAKEVATACADALGLHVVDTVTDPARRRDAPKPLLLAGAPHPGPVPPGCQWPVSYDEGRFRVVVGADEIVMQSGALRVGGVDIPAAILSALEDDGQALVARRIGAESVAFARGVTDAHRAWLLAAVRFYVGGGDAQNRIP